MNYYYDLDGPRYELASASYRGDEAHRLASLMYGGLPAGEADMDDVAAWSEVEELERLWEASE